MVPEEPASHPSAARGELPAEVRIGEWRIDPASGDASDGRRTLRLQARPLSVLLYLWERPGRVVSKEELLETVWEGRFVTQDVVWRAVSKLRRTLTGDGRARNTLVETIPGRGYRLVASRAPADEAAGLPSARGLPRWPLSHRRVAVAVVTLVAVVAWWTWRAGSDEPRAEMASGALTVASPVPADAREHYLRGLAYYKRLDPVDVERSIAAYQRALELDPGLVEARAALASSYCIRGLYRYDHAELEKALATANQAVGEDPSLPEAHKARARVYLALGKNRLALEESRRAVEIDPLYPEGAHNLGAALNRLGRPHEALQWHYRAVVLQPRQVVFAKGLGDAYYLLGEWSEARRWYREALEREPFHDLTTAELAKIEILEERFETARRLLARTLAVHPESPELLVQAALLEHVVGDLEAAKGYLESASRATAGKDARVYLRQLALRPAGERDAALERFVSVGQAAINAGDEDWGALVLMSGAESLRGRVDEAIELLSEAIDLGFMDYRRLQVDPIYAGLWDDRRFAAMMRRVSERARGLRTVEPPPAPPRSAPIRLSELTLETLAGEPASFAALSRRR